MTEGVERRNLLQGTVGLLAGAAAAAALGVTAHAEPTLQSGARAMAYEIKPLAVDPKSVKGI
jgi:Fe-Mn family superoxide dismutase